MADIKIYGKLVNDTDGILAGADQIVDPRTGEKLTDILDGLPQGGGPGSCGCEEMTDEEFDTILSSADATPGPEYSEFSHDELDELLK